MAGRTIFDRFTRASRQRRAAARAALEQADLLMLHAGEAVAAETERAGAPVAATARARTPATGARASEVDAMQSLVSTLAELPGEVWDHAVPPPVLAGPRAVKAPRRINLRQGLAVAAVAACLLVAFLAGSVTHPTLSSSNRLTAQTPHVVLAPLPGVDSRSRAVAYMTSAGGMRLHVSHLIPSGPDTYYELWLMTSDSDLVSVTSFRVDRDGRADLTLRLPADPSDYRYLDISEQRVGAGASISDRSVLRGVIG